MIDNKYYPEGFFNSRDEGQNLIFLNFKKLRAVFGTPHRYAYLRALVRTRKFTRSVYPPGWRFR